MSFLYRRTPFCCSALRQSPAVRRRNGVALLPSAPPVDSAYCSTCLSPPPPAHRDTAAGFAAWDVFCWTATGRSCLVWTDRSGGQRVRLVYSYCGALHCARGSFLRTCFVGMPCAANGILCPPHCAHYLPCIPPLGRFTPAFTWSIPCLHCCSCSTVFYCTAADCCHLSYRRGFRGVVCYHACYLLLCRCLPLFFQHISYLYQRPIACTCAPPSSVSIPVYAYYCL